MTELQYKLYKSYSDSLKRESKHHRQYAEQRIAESKLVDCLIELEEEIKTLTEENQQLKKKKK